MGKRYKILMTLLIAAFVILLIVARYVIPKDISKFKEKFKEDYVQPDTTIIYRSGKWDTTITKKSLPAWLR